MNAHHAAISVREGTLPADFRRWETTQILFHQFRDLDATKGELVSSPRFTRFGHQWILEMFPGGDQYSHDGMVAMRLWNMSDKSIEIEFGFAVKCSDGANAKNCGDHACPWEIEFPPMGWAAFSDFSKRDNVLDALVGGTLVVEVRMRPSSSNRPPFIAANAFSAKMSKLFLDVSKLFLNEESADIVFEVEDTQTSRVTLFHAHRIILKQCAPMIAELCGSGDGSVPVPITGTRPDIFRLLLYYVYGLKVAEKDFESHAKDIIEAADKYSVVNLKLEAEAWYVQSTKIDFDNVMDLLLDAHRMNCALLKEAAMDFLVDNGREALEKVTALEDAPGGLLPDLLAATTRGEDAAAGAAEGDLGAMRVGDLRRRLNEMGLDVDGSRETLIAALKENS